MVGGNSGNEYAWKDNIHDLAALNTQQVEYMDVSE